MQGNVRQPDQDWSAWYHDAAITAASLPALLVEASAIAHTVAPGWHGRRQPGIGEAFWEYRRFTQGDLPGRIDWRRSARDDHLYIREQEWEAAHTVWLWPDRSASMAFRSDIAPVSKEYRAIVMALALGEILVRGGERIAVPGLGRPMSGQRAPRRLAEAIARMPATREADPGLPPAERISAHSDLVILSDFLVPADEIARRIAAIAAQGARPHLVQVFDPVEETFPFKGRIEFTDTTGEIRYLATRAENLRAEYKEKLALHRAALRDIAGRHQGTFIVHHTDKPPHPALLALHAVLAAPRDLLRPPTEEHAYAIDAPRLVSLDGSQP